MDQRADSFERGIDLEAEARQQNLEGHFGPDVGEFRAVELVGTRSPAQLLVLDTTTGRIVATLASVGDADDIFYDRNAARIYVSGGEGFVYVFEQLDVDHYRLAEKNRTRSGARTSLYVPEWKTLFVALPAA